MAAERGLRVLMTTDTVGGVWHHALELAAGLAPHGVTVALASMGRPPDAVQRAQAAALPNVSLHESGWRLEWMDEPWSDVRQAGDWLLQLEAELRPDLIHLNQFSFGSLPFVAPTLLVAHSCVLSWWRAVHGEAAPSSWNAYRQAVGRGLAGADLVGAPTASMLGSLADNYGHAGPGVVLPNARDPATYLPGTKQPVILSAGRLWDAAKNLGALEAVAPRLPWPVRVAGASSQPTGGVRRAKGVTSLGELQPAELAREFASAAIYALPARYEPFGQSVLEAGLSGCALVLGDLPSLREVWGDAALYVAPDDHAALQAVLTRLIGDDRLRARQAQRARQRAATYSLSRMVGGYLDAYRRILPGAARRPRGVDGTSARPGLFGETVCAS